jgi:serine/threonine protein kinase/tetratricopeptide (TPR) repeat protein
MSLSKGDRLGPYEILAPIGAGGMGSVYKARDTRLDRIVAVKVSKAEFSQRFEREARAVAALNHTNICHLYDVGPNYLVMEYVEGAPIAPTDNIHTLLEQAMQVADGMAAAHALGVTHRDLKPGNILVTRAGQVKILDFGLAVVDSDSGAAEPDATATMALTDPGTAIGTVAYMSPEQARGQKVDARSDLWSLGVILYEMATRTRPFSGPTTPVVFEGILTKAPVPVREKNPQIPAELERIIAKLLEKDRETRYQSAADVRADLKRVERDSSGSQSGVGLRPASGAAAQPVLPAPEPPKSSNWMKYAIAAGALVLIAGGVLWWQRAQANPLTDKDVLVLADFTNTTGDPVFDGTLRTALSVQLDESPFLKIMPDAQVRHDLQLTGRSPDERVTNPIAREICVREGEKATIGGSIASLGKTYAITLQATNCQTGDAIAQEQAEAPDKEHVLKAVVTAASGIRAKLGESLSSIQKKGRVEGDEVTTNSLEAFQAYSMGMDEFRSGSLLASVPLFKRATELDPNFAAAWIFLGTASLISGGGGFSADLTKAFDLRDRVSERERLNITAFYYQYVTGEWDKGTEAASVWARTYPRSPLPHNTLGNMHMQAGELEEAVKEYQEAYRLEPQNTAYVAQLTRAYISLDRFDEAKAVVEKGISQGLVAADLHGLVLTIGYLQGDHAAQDREMHWFAGKPEEYVGQSLQANEVKMLGQRTVEAELLRRAAESARRGNALAVAAQMGAPDVLSEALLGDCGPARTGRDPLALALCADAAQVEAIADATTKQQPLNTQWNAVLLPIIRAAMELKRDQPAKTIELLLPVTHYERAYPQVMYLRGQAYLRLRKGPEASAEFQKIANLKGVSWGTLYYPLAYLGVARAASVAGDAPKAKKAYQDFFGLWKDADKDIPILMDARKEYAALQ